MYLTIRQQQPSEQTQTFKHNLSRTAKTIYEALYEVALEVGRARAYSPKVGQVSYHIPAEVVALALGIHRATLYRHLPQLVNLGLLDYRAHITTCKGRRVSDGTVWSIAMNPQQAPAKVRYEDLKHEYRDLEADIRRGRTAWAAMRQSKTFEKRLVNTELLLNWALPHRASSNPVTPDCRTDLETVLDVPSADKGERGQMVDAAAHAAATHLGDKGNLNFYRWLLWQLLRLQELDSSRDRFQTIYLAIRRAGVDQEEGFARKAGALLVSRLKQSGLWEELRQCPAVRVGSKPNERVRA
jgi:hypothetical protein